MGAGPTEAINKDCEQAIEANMSYIDEPATIPGLVDLPKSDTKTLPVLERVADTFGDFCDRTSFSTSRAAAAALVWFMEVDGVSRHLAATALHEFEKAWDRRARAATLLDDNLESIETRELRRQLGQEKHAREQLEGALADKSRRRRTAKKPNGGTKR